MGYKDKEFCCCCVDLRTGVWIMVILCFLQGFNCISLIAGFIGLRGLVDYDAKKIRAFWLINVVLLIINAVLIVAIICGAAIATKQYFVMAGLVMVIPSLLLWYHFTSVIRSYEQVLLHQADKHSEKHSDHHSDKHSDKQGDKHSDHHSDKHSDHHSEKHSDHHSDKHSDHHSEKHSDHHSDKHSDKHSEKHSEKHSDKKPASESSSSSSSSSSSDSPKS